MKKKIIIGVISLLVIILLSISYYFYSLGSVKGSSEVVTFKVEGSAKKIINDLYEQKIIKSKLASTIYLKLHKDIIIKAGTYELDRAYDTKKIFNIISGNNAIKDTIKVTFVPGKRIVDYIKVITDNFGYSEEEILSVLNDREYLNTLILKYPFLSKDILNSDIYYSLEGYLFPDTYEFYKNSGIKVIFEKMLAKMGKVLDNYSTSFNSSKYNYHEILTIASIIENETMVKEDRSIVSQVIYKRLDLNMSLGMDVTTYYGAKKALSETLTQKDLNTLNAYNTRNKDFIGLPVGPISNPSEASIKAALSPADTDYLYFYADIKTGKLYFAKTYAEHQELARKYG